MIHLGLSLTPFGHDTEAWQGASREALGFDALLKQAVLADEAGFDFIWLADRMGERPVDTLSPLATPFEPTTLASALATRTKSIGLVATAATHQHEPYNLARRFASLDWISHGRAGWAIVAGTEDARDREYVELVSALWDSWEDDAFIYDKAAGRFFVPEKMHVLNHKGANFSVRGPLNVNRSPQGKPILAAVSSSPVAHLADVIFVLDGAPIAEIARARADVRVIKSITDFTGVAADVADIFEREAESGIDGFVLMPSTTADLNSFIETVVPELTNRGLLATAKKGGTFRERLGLSRPAHPASLERAS